MGDAWEGETGVEGGWDDVRKGSGMDVGGEGAEGGIRFRCKR